ncbi:MAG: tRNA 2-selenouridine(34) synthase MnmH [Negativicutes bacterium]|nr:tRNA 2-selenouridine(34) synthase MnmH [Negativicutes bacterium]
MNDVIPAHCLLPAVDNRQFCLIDVRSPVEFYRGHVPEAVNCPLFCDHERAEIGTLYKNCGKPAAVERGHEIIGPRLFSYLDDLAGHAAGRTPLVMCWRGGMRSAAVVEALRRRGLPARQISGGYKAWRRCLLEALAGFDLTGVKVFVLCGSTGVGKTQVINILKNRGMPAIDLEELANHRGSIFGHIGKGEPCNSVGFDSRLLTELASCRPAGYLIFECESRRIGNVYLPDNVYQAIVGGSRILIRAAMADRVARILDEYRPGCHDTGEIAEALSAIARKLGGSLTGELHRLLAAGRLEEFTELLLRHYYDPLYGYEGKKGHSCEYTIDGGDVVAIADQVIRIVEGVAD